MLYHFIHNIVDAIILYSPNEIKYIKKHNRHKVFIANNTLNFADIRRESYNAKHHLRDHYGVKENFSVLFAGRINRYKKIHLLLEIFRDHEDIAVVIVGNGMKSKERLIIERVSNYYWLGEIYNRDEMARIFSSADVFCIPGNLGLGMNEAFFWGKPVLTIKDPVTINSPEIWYLEDGVNGFKAENIQDLENKIILLKSNREIYRSMSVSAIKTANNKAHISQMFKGFKDAVEFVLHESSQRRSEFNNLFFQ
jgi:glycosyltransferase involved in cell wall biosynthesis